MSARGSRQNETLYGYTVVPAIASFVLIGCWSGLQRELVSVFVIEGAFYIQRTNVWLWLTYIRALLHCHNGQSQAHATDNWVNHNQHF